MTDVNPEVVAPTPEVAAYRAQKEVTTASQLKIWHRVAAGLGVALLVSVGTNLYNVSLTHEIRTTQDANTTRANCQTQAFNSLLRDVPLAFAGDKNPHDYAKVNTKC